MYHYRAFGLHVTSDLPLPTFPPLRDGAERSEADVAVRRRPVSLDEWQSVNDDGDHLLGSADRILRFKVLRGAEIQYDFLDGADEDYGRAILSGELFSALLRQRGLLVLHGSCVELGGEAIAFLGRSGCGKSTLAASLLNLGCGLVTDDALAIDLSGSVPMALPGQGEMKLNEDVGALALADFDRQVHAHAATSKRAVRRTERLVQEPVPLRRIYLLEPRTAGESVAERLSPSAALLPLLAHTRATKLIKDPEHVRRHFEQCSALVQEVPVATLHRSGGLPNLSRVVQVVRENAEWA